MDEDLLLRRIAVGLMDEIPPSKRTELILGNRKLSDIVNSEKIRQAENAVMFLDRNHDCGVWWCTEYSFPDYSPVTRALPYMLFYRGRKPAEKVQGLGIVGTRRCDSRGMQKAFELGLEASVNGISVITGLAEGCDQAAAEGAVQGGLNYHDSAPCYGIIGCGLDIDYPMLSGKLKDKIIKTGGAIISRFVPGTLPYKQNFPNRNLTIAAMSSSVVAVQAPQKSGTLITTDFALQMGKDVYVSTEGRGTSSCRRGTNELLEEGAFEMRNIGDVMYNPKWKVFKYSDQTDDCVRFGNYYYTVESFI